jgi:ribonuclease HI
MALLNSFRILKGVGRPHLNYLVQTDASFFPKTHSAKTGVILFPNEDCIRKEYSYMKDSFQAEYQSVLDGLRFARDCHKPGVALENDCAGVISAIVSGTLPRKKHVEACHRNIEKILDDFDWVAIRWIPRELNQADAILR